MPELKYAHLMHMTCGIRPKKMLKFQVRMGDRVRLFTGVDIWDAVDRGLEFGSDGMLLVDAYRQLPHGSWIEF